MTLLPRRFPATRSRTSAFTLVELLVVIGIIALLISILLPTITTVRRSAIRTTCAAQLRDIGNAFQMYLNESKGRIPEQVNPLPLESPTLFVGKPTLFDAFDRYLGKSRKVWGCPGDHYVEPDPNPTLVGHDRYVDAYGVSYEYNFYMNVLSPGRPFVQVLKDAQIAFGITPTRFRIFNDLTHFHGPVGRNGNMNFLFADWHVADLEGLVSAGTVNPSGK
ncbi:MAG: putative major pilin subunit [Phycisphaerales bacterium]|nr:putative major pilin subunit [Phycisphaerales bacterium]